MEIKTKPSLSPKLSQTGRSLEESVSTLTETLESNPENVAARRKLYETMQQLLRKDAFLAYQGETDVLYKICTLAEHKFVHPKDRAQVEPFPPKNTPPARTAINWLGWSLVGLIPSGLGTLVIAPLAINAAIKLLGQQVESIDRRRAWIVITVAILLWLIALVFFFILILHLV
jgi:hypothetical protein